MFDEWAMVYARFQILPCHTGVCCRLYDSIFSICSKLSACFFFLHQNETLSIYESKFFSYAK